MAAPLNYFSIQTLIIFFNLFSISQSITSFTYIGFNNTEIITRFSATVKSNGALRLTTTSKNAIGHAFHPHPIPIFNTTTTTTVYASSFSTHFIFRIVPANSNRGGFGLAFTLSPSPAFPGGAAGHFLGVFNKYNNDDPSNHVFMVEFDTVNGFNEKADTDGNHVAVNINGLSSTNSLPSIPAARYLDGSQKTEEVYLERETIQAWIDYDGLNKLVNVTVAPLNISKPNTPLISSPIDLSTSLVNNMYAGFSASTGDKSSSHYILGWSFRLNGKADHLDQSLLPVVPVIKSTSSKLKTALIATFSVLLFILVASLIGVASYRHVMKYEELEEWELDCPHRFRYRDLHKATKGFKESEKIGEGGFGAVYRGVLPSTGAEVAVKKIMSNNQLRGIREFAAEIESLGRLRHKNLVNLQGWCKNKENLLLVYDYVPNGSLDSLLYDPNSGIVLSWEQRFNIVKGVASGLLYLHEDWGQVVIHRDVKSSNILIDLDMSPRLGDFGLARLYDHGKNSHTTNVVGTIGYIAPELTRTGKASTSSDVFAYGILLLEIACGRAAVVCEAHQNVILVDWVAECMQMGSIFDAVDEKLNCMYVVDEMELVLGLGLLCSHPKAESRPTMRQVMKYLNGDEVMPLFERLSSAGSRRVDEVTSRLLALGLSDSVTISTKSYHSTSIGAFSSTSFYSGR